MELLEERLRPGSPSEQCAQITEPWTAGADPPAERCRPVPHPSAGGGVSGPAELLLQPEGEHRGGRSGGRGSPPAPELRCALSPPAGSPAVGGARLSRVPAQQARLDARGPRRLPAGARGLRAGTLCRAGGSSRPRAGPSRIFARVLVLSRGLSGVRPELVQLLVDMLNEDIWPEIPSQGSVGAAGDLAPLAHLAQVVFRLGGRACKRGVWMSGEEAMEGLLLSVRAPRRPWR